MYVCMYLHYQSEIWTLNFFFFPTFSTADTGDIKYKSKISVSMQGSITLNMLFMKGSYCEEFQQKTCFELFYTFITSSIFPCVLMPSARNCSQ